MPCAAEDFEKRYIILKKIEHRKVSLPPTPYFVPLLPPLHRFLKKGLIRYKRTCDLQSNLLRRTSYKTDISLRRTLIDSPGESNTFSTKKDIYKTDTLRFPDWTYILIFTSQNGHRDIWEIATKI